MENINSIYEIYSNTFNIQLFVFATPLDSEKTMSSNLIYYAFLFTIFFF
jgi:hypothetical protein